MSWNVLDGAKNHAHKIKKSERLDRFTIMSTIKKNKTKTFAFYIKVESFFSSKYENENKTETFLAGFYLFKVNNRNNRTMCEICSKVTIRHHNIVNDFILVSLLLILNIIHTLLWCFYCSLWTSKCRHGCV